MPVWAGTVCVRLDAAPGWAGAAGHGKYARKFEVQVALIGSG
jgi:hypothetical protein